MKTFLHIKGNNYFNLKIKNIIYFKREGGELRE
jgi:hypothetical protein